MKKLFVTCYSLFAICLFTAQHSLLIAQNSSLKTEGKTNQVNPPIYIAFLWHMHQPIYWPYETVNQTDQNNRYSYSVTDIHNQRIGPYTTWPKNAVQSGINANLQHLGAQVSFSGSLIENLNNLEAGGNGNFSNWKSSWNYIKQQNTSFGNPRLDMVGFGYHHPLMGLIDYLDTRKQIQAHKQIMSANFSGSYSKGIFPPENAFAPKMIPALVAEGIEWVLVDNVHFDRACNNYPFSTSGNLYEPNKADVLNPNPNDWVQLNGLWAPTRNSAQWGRQPHYVEYIDPNTGTSTKIIAVPADRYMGNEDGRGGFGALNYENVMSQLEAYNTDPNHPILIVLHHDGDNYGGGSDSYYNSNFSNFVNWLSANPTRFVGTTVQDYLEMFPPSTSDVIHIENGSWSGADNGDPEFKKWLGDPDGSGYSPDRNSWGVVTAAKNFVMTAEQINSGSSNTTNAWKYMLNGEASDYWYWDGSQNGIWDSHPTRAVNQAVQYAQSVVNSGSDLTGPTIFQPQREPYNPGATEWGINQPSDMTVWTYVFDVHGLKSVKLKYRTDVDGVNSTSSSQNETYSGGSEVNAWVELNMSGVTKSSTTNPSPLYKAKEFSAQITGLNNVLLDYYVEAVDSFDNVSKSVISHVWIGQNSGGGGGESGVSWSPVNPTNNDTITITVSGATQGAKLHWGVNNVGSSWQTPNSVYRPAGSTLFNGTGPAVESPMTGPDTASKLTIKLGPFNNVAQAVSKIAFVIHYNDNTWDNNSGQDYHIELPDTSQPTQTFTMDGQLDVSAQSVASNGGLNLYLGWNNTELYVATQSAQQQGGDMFIFVSDSQRAVTTAQWAKAGSVAAWDVFLGNESSNNWNGWFDKGTSTTVTNSAGTYLEGTINILQEFGKIPAKLYIAVGKYQTPDGGSLTAQVPAGNGNGNIEPTELYEFDYTFSGVSPPAAPNLSSPSNGATNQTTTVSLQWSASSGATLYHVALSIDSTFTATIVNDSNVSSTGKSVSSLSYSTKYYWRARAKNAGGWGDWSATWNFTTMAQPQPPDTPVLLFPPNDTTNILRDVTCQWQSSSGATAYHIAVSKDSAFATTIVNDSLVNSTFKQVSSLSINTTYYWRVRAKNSVGWSAWTSVRNFTSGNPYPRVSIHDIQFVPDSLLVCLDEGVCPPSSQYSQYVGDTVTITALCIAPPRTLKFGGGFSLLVSDTGAYGLWKGVLVIANSSDTNQLISDGIMEIKRGKVFEMLCVVNEFSGEPLVTNTHLTPLPGNSIKILGTKNVPIPIKSNLTDVKKYQTAEPREGIYTYITDVVVIGYINVGGGTAFTVVDDIGNEVTITRLTIDQEIPLPELYSSIDTLRGLVYSVFSSPYPAYSKCYITPITPSDIVYASHYVSPTSLNFGYAQVDSSRIGSFCFYNQLGTSITVQSIVSTNPVFTVFPETTTIPARSSKSFNVTFTPTNTGDFSGYILLTHTASSQPESIFVNGTGVSYAPIDVSISVFEGWNLLSLPVLAGNDSVHHIFPQALSQPFFFDHSNGYGTSQRIERGKGYWLKFDTTQNISVSGFQIDADTIDVKAGWNLIGTISEPVSIDSVISIPDGIISSQFFGYHFGYVSPTVLEPAKGYWVKVSQDGKIYLSGTTMYKR